MGASQQCLAPGLVSFAPSAGFEACYGAVSTVTWVTNVKGCGRCRCARIRKTDVYLKAKKISYYWELPSWTRCYHRMEIDLKRFEIDVVKLRWSMVKHPITIHVMFNNKCWFIPQIGQVAPKGSLSRDQPFDWNWYLMMFGFFFCTVSLTCTYLLLRGTWGLSPSRKAFVFVELFGSPSNSQHGKRPLGKSPTTNIGTAVAPDCSGIQVKQPQPWSRSTTSTIAAFSRNENAWKRLKTGENQYPGLETYDKAGLKRNTLSTSESEWTIMINYEQFCNMSSYHAKNMKHHDTKQVHPGRKDVAAAVYQSPLRPLARCFKHHIATQLGSAMGKQGFDSRTALANATWRPLWVKTLVFGGTATPFQHLFLQKVHRSPHGHYNCETEIFSLTKRVC